MKTKQNREPGNIKFQFYKLVKKQTTNGILTLRYC